MKWLSSRVPHPHLYLLLALALAFKGTFLARSEIVGHDGPLYLSQARLLLEGNWQEVFSLPFNQVVYPGLIAFMGLVVDDLELAGRLVSFVASVLVVIPFYHLVRDMFDDRAALLATASLLISPGLNEYSVEIMRDPVFVLVLISACCYTFKFIKHKKLVYLILAFVFSIASIFFRLEGFLFLTLLSFYVASICFNVNKSAGFRLSRYIFVVIFPMILAVIVYNNTYFFEKNFRIDHISERIAWSFNDPDQTQMDEIKAKIREIRYDLLHSTWDNDFFEIVVKNIRIIYFIGLFNVLAGILWMPCFILALVAMFKYKNYDKLAVFAVIAAIVYFVFSYLYLIRMNFIVNRYVFPAAIFLYPWLGLALSQGLTAIQRYRGKKLLSVLFLAIFLAWPGYKSFGHLEGQMYSGKWAGRWLAEQRGSGPVEVMMANDGTVPFYSGQGWQSFILLSDARLDISKEADWPRINKLAVDRGAEIIALSLHRRKMDFKPQFDDFTLIKTFEDPLYRQLIFRRSK